MTPSIVPVLSGFVDELFYQTVVRACFQPRHPERTIERLHHASVRLAALSEEQLYPKPASANLRKISEGRYRGMKNQKFVWDSPVLPAAQHFELEVNSTLPQVTLFGNGSRPIWILVHGWLGGSRLMDEVFWPLTDLYRTHDIALYMLPGHGARKVPSFSVFPSFPSRNPIRNVLGLLAAVTELRELTEALSRKGYSEIGIAGTSLGVQVVALLATVEDCASRYLFDRPLVELSEPLRRMSMSGLSELEPLASALESFYRPVRPLCRRSCVRKERIDVLLAEQDRVVGRGAGATLADYFGVTPQSFSTGHVWSLGREAVVVEIMRKLRETTPAV